MYAKKKILIISLICIISANVTLAEQKQYIQQLHEQRQNITKPQPAKTNTAPAKSYNKPVTKTSVQTVNGDYEKYYQEAKAQIKANNLYGAQTSLCKALEIKHDYIPAIQTRGEVRNNLGNYTGAIQDFNNAIALNPNDGDSYYGRGFAKLALQNYAEAIEDFDKAIEINPDDIWAYHQRGYSQSLLAKSTNNSSYFNKALYDFYRVLRLDPNFTEARLYCGMTLCELDSKEYGLRDIETAIKEYKEKGDEAGYNRAVEIYNWIKRDY